MHMRSFFFTSVFILAGQAHSACLPSNDTVPACRYEQGDAWCAQYGKGKQYAYSDECLKQQPAPTKRGSADVSGLTALRQEMKYSQAREIILNAGWQGKNMRWQEVPEFSQVKDLYFTNGWREVVDCSGTGTAPCRFEYSDIHGNLLVVITEGECLMDNGEYPEEGEKCDLIVSNWFLE